MVSAEEHLGQDQPVALQVLASITASIIRSACKLVHHTESMAQPRDFLFQVQVELVANDGDQVPARRCKTGGSIH
jgi:hypothetical protein